MRQVLFIFCLLSFYFSAKSQVSEAELLGRWFDENIPGSIGYNNAYNEVWGLAINGQEYAIIGSTLGTHFINVTDPLNPVEDFFIVGAVSDKIVVHRDYHDYKGFLYAVSDEDFGTNQSTLQIMDISNLPESVDVVYDSNDLIRKAHNIFIDTASARLYALAAAGGDWPYSPARVYDISNPTSPQLIKRYSEFENTGVGHVHDAYVNRDTAYLNCGGDGLLLVDFTDPYNEKLIANLTALDYPDAGYNHSGWATEDGNYYYMADETWGKAIKVLNVKNKSAIETIGTFDAGSPSASSIPHNLIAHCNYLFVSYYYDGLQIYDISEPENPQRVLYYPTSSLPHKETYEGAWGVYPFLPSGNVLVSDMQEGLFVIKGPEDLCQISSAVESIQLKLDVKAFPNPTDGKLYFETSGKFTGEEFNYRVYNAIGILLDEGKIEMYNQSNLDLSTFKQANSLLFVQIAQNNTSNMFKIVIE